MSESMAGRYLFVDIGRHKAQFEAEIRNEDDVERAVRPHLMSREIEWEYDGARNAGRVFAGFRQVGTFTRLDSLAGET